MHIASKKTQTANHIAAEDEMEIPIYLVFPHQQRGKSEVRGQDAVRIFSEEDIEIPIYDIPL